VRWNCRVNSAGRGRPPSDVTATTCLHVLCMCPPPERFLRLFRPPARPLYWWKLNKHARCLCPWAVQSVQTKHSRSCYDRSRATVAQRISTCFLVSKGHCTYKDLSCPYMRHHSTVPTYVLLHGAQDPLLQENIMRLVKLSIVELLGWWISRLISRLMLFYCGRKTLYHDC
jgi:hypothetical protein